MLKVLTVFGTRPEAIKLAPVIRELFRRRDEVESHTCVTAQHREMLDQVLRVFAIRPDHDLDIMRPRQTLSQATSDVFSQLDPVLQEEAPDWVLVQGDTTTVMATSIAAFYHRCRVGHVEAGLRTGDKYRPFPEEINRRIASTIADIHFAPTNAARRNLLREGHAPKTVVVTGNPIVDAVQMVLEKPYDIPHSPLAGIPFEERRIILVTAHRRENFGPAMQRICRSLLQIRDQHSDVHIVYPVHLNPRVQEPVYRLLSDQPGITLLPPLDYLTFINLANRADVLLTDSGGLQEEAAALKKPVLVMREVTERPEAVEAGIARLVGTEPARILSVVSQVLRDPSVYGTMASAQNPFGDGTAAQQIVEALLSYPKRKE